MKDEIIIEELGDFLIRLFRIRHSAFQKRINPQSKPFGVQETFMESCKTVDVWIEVSFPIFFSVMYKEQKKATFLAVQRVKKWKSWMTMAVPKFKISLMKNGDFVELAIQTQDHTSLCRVQGKFV